MVVSASCPTCRTCRSCRPGPGADLIGRAAGLLVDLPVEAPSTAWRLAPRPGATCAGPATCSARTSTRSRSGRGVRRPGEDPGARAVDARRRPSSCRTGDDGRCATPARCATWPGRSPRGCARTSPRSPAGLPGARLVLQLDEPGRCPPCWPGGCRRQRAGSAAHPRSGEAGRCGAAFGRTRPTAGGATVCALLRAATRRWRCWPGPGPRASSVDLDPGRQPTEPLGEADRGGARLLLAGVGADVGTRAAPRRTRRRAGGRRCAGSGAGSGSPPRLAVRWSVTPTCGLAGASPAGRAHVTRCGRRGRRLADSPEDLEGRGDR